MKFFTTLALVLASLVAAPRAQHDHDRPSWDPEVITAFEKLNVLEGGRVKPLYTQAIWLLRRLNGKASVLTPPSLDHPKGERLGPVAWFLDTLFLPEHANDYECFRIEDDNVITALGLDFRNAEGLKTKKRFDRYSWNELRPGFERLTQLARTAQGKDKNIRSALETNVLALYSGLNEYASISSHLGFARMDLPVGATLRPIFGGKSSVRISDVLIHSQELREFAMQMQNPAVSGQEQVDRRKDYAAFSKAVREAVSRADHHPVMFPPTLDKKASPAWLTPQDIVDKMVFGDARIPDQDLQTQASLLINLEQMARDSHDPVAFRKSADVFVAGLTNLANRRGEGSKAGAEVWLYKMEFFWNAIYAFLGGFLMLALSWLFTRGSEIPTSLGISGLLILLVGYVGMIGGVQPHLLLTILFFVPLGSWLLQRDLPIKTHLVRGALGFGLLAAALMITGIATRGYVRSRPPISTLYETFPFIAAVCVLASLIIEWVTRNGLGLALALLSGFVLLMLGNRYAEMKAEDTMPQLVAVLDTNFWLATHVTTINIGYAAGVLAGLIAHIFLIGKLFGLGADNRAFYKVIVRMVYGVLAFGLIFSVVGTILGGIWANDSWGRFWGWDPKENGALLICLVQAAILHGRMGGFLRDFGICIWAVIGNIVVAFSWFHVNLLQIGLHSYGFDGNLYRNLVIFYGIESVVVLAGMVAMGLDKMRKQALSSGTGADSA